MLPGANYKGNGICEFMVWAPFALEIVLYLHSPDKKQLFMDKDRNGYWTKTIEKILPGTLYTYQINGKTNRPDPVSFYQPHGVHEASEVIDHASFRWQDAGWNGMVLSEMIMYELRLDDLKDTGINAVELMPVAQFPGKRNWGYDGVYPYAVQNSYGGPDGLKQLVNECHQKGIAVILDVVYNHLGPEGNYLRDYGPYFTDRYKTPWGEAINFDGPYSNEVRSFFIENALYWFRHYHIDALRIDAVHGMYDMSAKHFLLELAERVEDYSKQVGRKFYLIAESNLNDSNVIRPKTSGGLGLDASWCDDFHHSVHTLLTGESDGYYADFGKMEHLVKSLSEGYVYSGQYSLFRKRNHGNSAADLPVDRFIVFSQNHDETGNRMLGERLPGLVSFESQKLAAGIVLLSPYIPLLFMGEEYGETAPFLYFISHSDNDLIEAVRRGRKEEFRAFNWKEEPPDPQSEETFERSKINWARRERSNHAVLLSFYKELIRLRKKTLALSNLDKKCFEVWIDEETEIIFMKRWKHNSRILIIFNFKKKDMKFILSLPEKDWKKRLDSSDKIWNGPGGLLPQHINYGEEYMIRGESFALYIRENN
jgi:maltooligosyltrehalose trehalohydrolase